MYCFLGKQFYLLCFFLICSIYGLLAEELSLSDIELTRIIGLQNRLLKNGKDWPEDELRRQAQEIVTSYENFLLDNPDNINALLLFGKFLRKTGLQQSAVELFLKADQLNPNIAVVKQELGNFLAEEGKPIEAFPFFLMATRLAPQEPTYHYNLGDFIFLFSKDLAKLENSEDLGALMNTSFEEATKLDPESFDYQLRFAQSFFDFDHAMQKEALTAWDTLLSEFGERTQKEKDYITLCKAKILLHLGKKQQAKNLLRSVQSELLQKEKNQLLRKAGTENKDRSKKSSYLPKSFYRTQNPNSLASIFLSDPNLRRMRLVTEKLLQEKMLDDFQHDVVEAKILSNGNISLELRKKPLSNERFK